MAILPFVDDPVKLDLDVTEVTITSLYKDLREKMRFCGVRVVLAH
jgi:hypothetical protein